MATMRLRKQQGLRPWGPTQHPPGDAQRRRATIVHIGDGAPLPPSTSPAAASIFAGSGTGAGWTMGPTLTGLSLGGLSSGLSTLNGAAIGAWYAQQAAQKAAAAANAWGPPPPGSIVMPPLPPGIAAPPPAGAPAIVVPGAPVPPTITLGQAQGPLPPGFVGTTLSSAASGNPQGIANAAVLTLAQKIDTQALFVARFVSQAAADQILTGAHLGS